MVLHGRHRVLGEPFILGSILAILGIDLTAWGAVEVFRPSDAVGCRPDLSFCYTDPVPDLVTDQWVLGVMAAVILVTVVGSIVLRHGIIVVLLMQTALAIVLVVQVLPNWADAAQKQNLLRACHYGVHGSCSGIVNLTG
ncbi:MAG TPA: hypothetical protein VFU35_09060 [Jatrophihabitans sp.]|nr:hypothetical protein [Jatrophihabitans sp.]